VVVDLVMGLLSSCMYPAATLRSPRCRLLPTPLQEPRRHGWQVMAHAARELYARDGFEFPEVEIAATFGDMSYVAATLE
jgi:hypothetical protein